MFRTNLRDAESIMDQVSRMENIQYSFTQNSVHFSRGYNQMLEEN